MYNATIMSKHRPVKFDLDIEPSLLKQLEWILENGRVKKVASIMWAIIATGGILTTAVMAPSFVGLAGRIFKERQKQKKELYKKLWRNFQNMKKGRSFEFVEESDGHDVFRITEEGQKKIRRVVLDELEVPSPKSWDGKWRLIIFDIPEKFKKARDAMRAKLLDMDFYQCQKSVWIHPFPCVEEIEFIKNVFDVKPFVKIFIVDEMTDGRVLYNFRDLLKDRLSN